MHTHKTFPVAEINTRETRLIFADQNSGGEKGENAEFDFRPDVEEWKDKTYKDYDTHLTEAQSRGKIEAEKVPALLAEARRKFAKWEEERRDAVPAEKIRERIERARHNREHKKIAKRSVDAVREKFLADVEEIRAFVRSEIKDFLKIPDSGVPKAVFEEYLEFENEILKSIQGLLKEEGGYAWVNESIERDKKRAKDSYKKLRELFQDKKKKAFLQLFLKIKGIPAGEKMNVSKIFELEEKMRGHWDESDTLIGVVNDKELRQLDQSLGAVETIYKKWNSIGTVEEENEIQKKFFEYENKLTNLNRDLQENPPKALELAWLVETWPDIYDRYADDLTALKKLVTKDKKEPTLRLAQAFLEGGLEEIRKLEEEIARVGATQQTREVSTTDEDKKAADLPEISSTSAPTLGTSGHGGHGELDGHGGHGPNAINQIGKSFKNFFTAHGQIRWYSFHDIEQAFHLIKESWKKHTESHTEDRSGKLAHGMMFWREEVRRRVHETDLIAEKGRADERKKRYKNLSYEELVSELVERPAKDKRRAILETLAERGNLRMSDHYLVNAITNNAVTEAEWSYADTICNYAEVVRKFKHAIDNHFIEEIGYGQQLIDMQTSGQANKESLGEKLGDHAVGGSPGAECAMVAVQIDNAGLEGDNVLTGILKKGFSRGNKFADNGAMCKINIRTENGNTPIEDNASAGLDALKIVDGYLKGLLSNQTIQGLSKKNEAGYTPYAAFQDVLTSKTERDPNNPSRAISKFELWGWIQDGVITNLGRRQIINFFDSRVAFDKEGKIIYIAYDSSTYASHSSKYTSITTFRDLSIPVADKMRTTCVKAGGLEIYENATQRAQNNNQIVGQAREVTFLIKAACEEIEDGVTMSKHGTTEEVRQKGRERLEKGTKALEIMFGNIIKNTEDRDIFLRSTGNPAYNIMQRKKDIRDKNSYGEVLSGEASNKGGLKGFLDHYLKTLTHADVDFPSHYNRVMRAYKNLADESKILPRELRDAKNKADEQAAQNRYRQAA